MVHEETPSLRRSISALFTHGRKRSRTESEQGDTNAASGEAAKRPRVIAPYKPRYAHRDALLSRPLDRPNVSRVAIEGQEATRAQCEGTNTELACRDREMRRALMAVSLADSARTIGGVTAAHPKVRQWSREAGHSGRTSVRSRSSMSTLPSIDEVVSVSSSASRPELERRAKSDPVSDAASVGSASFVSAASRPYTYEYGLPLEQILGPQPLVPASRLQRLVGTTSYTDLTAQMRRPAARRYFTHQGRVDADVEVPAAPYAGKGKQADKGKQPCRAEPTRQPAGLAPVSVTPSTAPAAVVDSPVRGPGQLVLGGFGEAIKAAPQPTASPTGAEEKRASDSGTAVSVSAKSSYVSLAACSIPATPKSTAQKSVSQGPEETPPRTQRRPAKDSSCEQGADFIRELFVRLEQTLKLSVN
ncbi:hypothetical protein LTR53_013624 [Teratosphaeriaceae sp. CCFEE 6253]|nr:hypothetical protein LTR53_013624 [Teratosphaeriaceae sp. CCFEE 6253]